MNIKGKFILNRGILMISFLFLSLSFYSQGQVDCLCPEEGKYSVGSIIPNIIEGNFSIKDNRIDIGVTCWDFGSIDKTPDDGFHYYDIYAISVSESGNFAITGSDENNKMLIGIYENVFNSSNACYSLVGGVGGYVDGNIYEQPISNGVNSNIFSLDTGITYYIVVSDFDSNYLGDYSFSISSLDDAMLVFDKKVFKEECIYKGCYEDNGQYNFVLPIYDSLNYSLSWIQTVEYGKECGTEIVKRNYTITDSLGNTSTCYSEYYFGGADLSYLEWPLNWNGLINNNPIIDCNSNNLGNIIPEFTGFPKGINNECGTIESFYNDIEYDIPEGKKILRNWFVINDCTGKVYDHFQIIVIANIDLTAPNFTKGEDIISETELYVCKSNIEIPTIVDLIDNCDPNPKWWVSSNVGVLVGDSNQNGFVDSTETWELLNIPLGNYSICYHAIDNIGNEAKECINLEVKDGITPIPICEQFKSVLLSDNSEATLQAKNFDSASFDNCSPVHFKVLRVDNNKDYDGGCDFLNGDDFVETNTVDVWYDDDIYYCCEDILLSEGVLTSLRVFDVDPGVGPINPNRMMENGDLFGHYNDCLTVVNVECKIEPELNCPPVIVECHKSLDPELNLDIRPEVTNVCGIELDYSDKFNQSCTPNLTRIWTATGCEKSTQCEQEITLDSLMPFDPCSIEFPDDLNTDCNTDFGKPIWEGGSCIIVSAEIIYNDTFNFVDGSCMKIIREWAVIDWCVYNNIGDQNVDPTIGNKLDCNQLVEDGYYRYTQIIFINDAISPNISVEDQCVATIDCYAYDVEMEAIGYDSCGITQDLNWKYIVVSLDTEETIQYSYNYFPKPNEGVEGKKSKDDLDKVNVGKLNILVPLPIGYYKITWTVVDVCNNTNHINQYFEVVDKTAPIPILVDIATIVMVDSMVEMKARTFDKGGCEFGCLSSSDNCAPKEGLYFTFSNVLPRIWDEPLKWSEQFAEYGMFFFNPNTGSISSENKYTLGLADAWLPELRTSKRTFILDINTNPELNIYLWDKFAYNEECNDNNYDYSTIIVHYNSYGQKLSVSGNVNILNTDIGFTGMKMKAVDFNTETYISSTITGNGNYHFKLSSGEYLISGVSDANYEVGISTKDLLIMQKLLLGLSPIDNPIKLLAADINNNTTITASDILELRKVLLRIKPNFTNNSWISLSNLALLDGEVIKDRKVIVNENDIGGVDFTAVKIGDIDNTVGLGWENRDTNAAILFIEDKELFQGEIHEISFYGRNFNNIAGVQFTMNISDLIVEDIISGAIQLSLNNTNIIDNNLLFSWFDVLTFGQKVNDDEVLFKLRVKAKTDLSLRTKLNLNDDILRTEVYRDTVLNVTQLSLQFGKLDDIPNQYFNSFKLYQNEPNPFTNITKIGFDLPNATNFNLSIYDINGKILKSYDIQGKEGFNQITVDKKEISSFGLLFYRLETSKFIDAKKMILLK